MDGDAGRHGQAQPRAEVVEGRLVDRGPRHLRTGREFFIDILLIRIHFIEMILADRPGPMGV